jgi:hypothetical protein
MLQRQLLVKMLQARGVAFRAAAAAAAKGRAVV